MNKPLSWTTVEGKSLSARQLKVEDLDAVYALSRKQLRAEIAPQSVARTLLEYNSDTIWGVYRADDSGETLAGFLSFLMLNAEGAALLRQGKLDVHVPQTRYLVPSGETPTLVYIWLVVAPGFGGLAIPLTTHAMGQRYVGLPLCSTAATEAGAQALRNFGFQPINPDRPDVGNVFRRAGARERGNNETNNPPAAVRITVAHTAQEVEHAFAIRAAVFMAEQNCPYAEEFDGNDYTATHLIGYVGGEPAATLRVRYFGEFVKIERLAVLKRFRGQAVADELVRETLAFCARKGYRRAYGHPQSRLLPFWEKYGFRHMPEIERFVFSDHEYVAVEGDLAEVADTIALRSDPLLILRPEGLWDAPGILDRSSERPATNPI